MASAQLPSNNKKGVRFIMNYILPNTKTKREGREAAAADARIQVERNAAAGWLHAQRICLDCTAVKDAPGEWKIGNMRFLDRLGGPAFIGLPARRARTTRLLPPLPLPSPPVRAGRAIGGEGGDAQGVRFRG